MQRIVFLSALVLLAGCSGRPATMLASTSPLPPGVRGTIPAKGSDCQYRLLGLIPITTSPSTQSALEEAKEDAEADVLTDVTVDENWGYYILFSNNCVRVQGLGVDRSAVAGRGRERLVW